MPTVHAAKRNFHNTGGETLRIPRVRRHEQRLQRGQKPTNHNVGASRIASPAHRARSRSTPETARAHLKAAGVAIRTPGAWGDGCPVLREPTPDIDAGRVQRLRFRVPTCPLMFRILLGRNVKSPECFKHGSEVAFLSRYSRAETRAEQLRSALDRRAEHEEKSKSVRISDVFGERVFVSANLTTRSRRVHFQMDMQFRESNRTASAVCRILPVLPELSLQE